MPNEAIKYLCILDCLVRRQERRDGTGRPAKIVFAGQAARHTERRARTVRESSFSLPSPSGEDMAAITGEYILPYLLYAL